MSLILNLTLATAVGAAGFRADAATGGTPAPHCDNATMDIRGTVLGDEINCLLLKTPEGGIRIEIGQEGGRAWKIGDIVQIRARRRCEADGRMSFTADDLQVAGQEAVPAPIAASARQVAAGGLAFGFATISGIVARVSRDALDPRWNWFVLRDGSGAAAVAVKECDFHLDDLRALTDAEVELRGLSVPFSSWRRRLGHHLLLNGRSGATVVRPAPENPFLSPPSGADGVLHRQKTSGVVLAVSRKRFFMRTDSGTLIEARGGGAFAPPEAGRRITAAGFVENGPFFPMLTDTVFRTEPGGSPSYEEPRSVAMRKLVPADGRSQSIDMDYNGRLVSISGTLHNPPEDIQAADTLSVGDGSRNIAVDVSAFSGRLPAGVCAGCTLAVSGMCLAEFESTDASGVFPEFRRFVLVPRTPEDIRVTARPPWWTPFRLTGVIFLLLAAIIAILIWNRALKILSKRRGRALYRERVGHVLAEQKVEERTRLAIELHDSLSQTLTGVALQIDAALRTSGKAGAAAGGFLETARRMLAECRQELRCCLWDLRSRTFEEKDLTEAIQRTLAPHMGSVALSVRFNVPRKALSESTTHTILKIVRELAVNAIQHGRASAVKVAGEHHGGVIRFSVRDNGNGFDQSHMPGPADGHFGLLGIRERLDAMGGSMAVDAAPGKGAKFTVTLNAERDGYVRQ